jgi:hypothetical protein
LKKFCSRIDWVSLLVVFMVILALLLAVVGMSYGAEGEAMPLTTIWNGGQTLPDMAQQHPTQQLRMTNCGVLQPTSIECLYDPATPAQEEAIEVKHGH